MGSEMCIRDRFQSRSRPQSTAETSSTHPLSSPPRRQSHAYRVLRRDSGAVRLGTAIIHEPAIGLPDKLDLKEQRRLLAACSPRRILHAASRHSASTVAP